MKARRGFIGGSSRIGYTTRSWITLTSFRQSSYKAISGKRNCTALDYEAIGLTDETSHFRGKLA